MKNMYKLALLAALGLGSITAAQAQSLGTDLVLGFNDSANTATTLNDYVIDLGSFSSLNQAAINAGGTLNLSSLLSASLLSSVTGTDTTLAGLSVGVAGGDVSGTTEYLWVSGSTTPTPTKPTSSAKFAGAAAQVEAVTTGGANTGETYASAGSTSFSSLVGPQGVVAGDLNAASNPVKSFNGSSDLQLGLYQGTKTGTSASSITPFVQEGIFDINVGTDTLTYTVPTVPVPEPATYGLLSGAGMLLLGLRRQLSRKA